MFDTEPARGCIHCGMCLESCPTSLPTRLETESPGGRIHLMQQLSAGRLEATDSLRLHLDRCLACRACEAVCPSGVGYGALIENARAALEERDAQHSSLGRWARGLALGLLGDPARLEGVAGLLSLYGRGGLRRLLRASGLRERLPRGPRRIEGLSPPLTRPRYQAQPAPAAPIARVALLLGCVMRVAYGDVHTATARVLGHFGVEVVDTPGQLCCGALHAHAGARDAAKDLARRNIAAFEAVHIDAIVVDAAGCGAHLKGYGHLLADDPEWHDRANAFAARVRDVTEYLAAVSGDAPLGRLALRASYQAACHLAHAQRITQQPIAPLGRVEGLELLEMGESDVCCGSAGSYNLQQPVLADALLARKLDAIAATGVDVVGSPNPGCMLQIASGLADRGQSTRVLHVVEVLDQAMP